MEQRIAAKALIVQDGRLLVLRESSGGSYADGTNAGKWCVPGGRIDPGEGFVEGLRREAREETGLEIEPVRPVFVGEWRPVIRDRQLQIIGIFFHCTVVGGEVRLSEEHEAYEWLARDELARVRLIDPEPAAVLALIETGAL